MPENYVFVRSRRTKEVSICKVDMLHRRQEAYSRPRQTLHFVGGKDMHACRCLHRFNHSESTQEFRSTHLRANLLRYMGQSGVESCHMSELYRHNIHATSSWGEAGVDIRTFHYLDETKEVVCRCTQHRHHAYRHPRNADIIEQCAEFFSVHKDRYLCTRKEWQYGEIDLPPAYSPENQHTAVLDHSEFRLNQLRYNRCGFLATISGRKARLTALCRYATTKQRFCQPIEQQPDIPEPVWKNCRRSAWVSQHDLYSTVSTPLGVVHSMSAGTSLKVTQELNSDQFELTKCDLITTNPSNIRQGALHVHVPDPSTESGVGATYSLSPVKVRQSMNESLPNMNEHKLYRTFDTASEATLLVSSEAPTLALAKEVACDPANLSRQVPQTDTNESLAELHGTTVLTFPDDQRLFELDTASPRSIE